MLIGSWHPKHSLPAAFLITLISADSFCCFTSDYFTERAGGNCINAPARREQSFGNKSPEPLHVLGRISTPAEVVVPQLLFVVLCDTALFMQTGKQSYLIALSQWELYHYVPGKFISYRIDVIVQKSQTLFEHSLDLPFSSHGCMAVCVRVAYTVASVHFLGVRGLPGRRDVTEFRVHSFNFLPSRKIKAGN